MNPILRIEWENRLETARLNPSWRARLEAKVLGFLLSRYAGSDEKTPVPARPFYRGESPEGRIKTPRSSAVRKRTLRRIERGNAEAHDEPVLSLPGDWLVEQLSYHDVKRHRDGNRTLNDIAKSRFYGAQWLQMDVGVALIKFAHRILGS